jgi:hypothetical protein
VELQNSLKRIQERGLGVAAISYDSVDILKNFSGRRGIAYPLLSDRDSKIIRAFGILNESVPAGNMALGVPNPGTYILDPNGVVVAKYFEDDFRERVTANDILLRQYGVEPMSPHRTFSGKHVQLAVSATDQSVLGGERVALAIDVDLKPGLHVYAPGVEGYIPIEWKLKDTGAATFFPVVFPSSRMLHLDAIDETVPVYEGRFRLVRDVTLAPEAKLKPLLDGAGEITIEGTLRYQACDDRLCYIPDTVPVKWTFQVGSHDRQRAPAEIQHK